MLHALFEKNWNGSYQEELNKRPTDLNGHLSIISHTGSLIFAFLSLTRLCSYVIIFQNMHIIPIQIRKTIIISISQMVLLTVQQF